MTTRAQLFGQTGPPQTPRLVDLCHDKLQDQAEAIADYLEALDLPNDHRLTCSSAAGLIRQRWGRA